MYYDNDPGILLARKPGRLELTEVELIRCKAVAYRIKRVRVVQLLPCPGLPPVRGRRWMIILQGWLSATEES